VLTDPLDVWRDALADWAIPEHILAAAPESPWLLPKDLFARRADAQIERPTGIALARAAEALPAAGTVLDVGAGAGAASLPLTAAARLIAVDTDAGMIAELRSRAAVRGLQVVSIVGRWPDVAPQTPGADVVVCSHVLYNVPDIGPFVVALGEHAGRRVVLEMTARHPLSALSPLWRRFHGIERPERPTWEDASAALRAAGIQPRVEIDRRPPGTVSTVSFEAFVRMTRIRLCLAPEREPEVASALVERGADPSDAATWTSGAGDLIVLWWDV
jgi:SAM-dependent methyltransferase